MQGQDLTTYYLREYEMPATLGYQQPSLPVVQPVRAMTPGLGEPAGNGLNGRVSFSNLNTSLLTYFLKGLPANWFMISDWSDVNASHLPTVSQGDGQAIPGTGGMSTSPSPTIAQRDGGAIPRTDEGPAQQDGEATRGTSPPQTDSDLPAWMQLPQLPRRDDGEISYASQGRRWFYNFEIITDIPFQSTSC